MKKMQSKHWDNPNIVGAIDFSTPGLGWVPNSNFKRSEGKKVSKSTGIVVSVTGNTPHATEIYCASKKQVTAAVRKTIRDHTQAWIKHGIFEAVIYSFSGRYKTYRIRYGSKMEVATSQKEAVSIALGWLSVSEDTDTDTLQSNK